MNNIMTLGVFAHANAGKTTITEQLLVHTKVKNKTGRVDHGNTTTDDMAIEQDRGISVRASLVTIPLNDKIIQLIDTPGHVDFSYEVSRSLAACEGAILVVDATQGIEAQTLANLHLALDNNLKIIPVINKIDLPAADPEKVTSELVDLIGFEKDEIILCSAKTGEGIEELLDAVVNRIPAPVSTGDKFRA